MPASIDVLVDTDVLVDHLRGARHLDLAGAQAGYSVITRAELFAGRRGDEAIVGRLLAAMTEVPIDRAIAERAGRLRRDLQILLPDALIAATALDLEVPLRTRNRRHYESVPSLRLVPEA